MPFHHFKHELPLEDTVSQYHLPYAAWLLCICSGNNMMNPTLDEQRRIVACLDGLQTKVNALRELQSAGGEELRPLFFAERALRPPSVNISMNSTPLTSLKSQ